MKRGVDVLFAATALLFAAPVIALLAVVVRIVDGSPVLHRQTRVGRGGQPFEILKFRTMIPRNGPKVTAANDARITALGARLRRWKLDELPQLWNVLRGDMSLVGPRPEVPEYVRLYPEESRTILAVRPGITGPAQLEGIDEAEILARSPDPERLYREQILPGKVSIDLEYAQRSSVLGDLALLWRTACRLVSPKRGVGR